MRPPVAQRAVVGVLEQLELRVAADERCLPPPLARVEEAVRAPRPDRFARAYLDRAGILDVDGADGQSSRAGADRHRAREGRLLEPRREDDGLAGHERRIAVADDDLTGLDTGAGLQPELVDRLEDGERGANRPFGVVLVRLRYAERRHHRVAGELLDRSAVQLDARRGTVEVVADSTTDHLGVAGGDERGRVDQVDEEDGCELALHAPSLGTRRQHAEL